MNRVEAIPTTARRSVFLVLLLVLALVLVPAGCMRKVPASETSDQTAENSESSQSLGTEPPIMGTKGIPNPIDTDLTTSGHMQITWYGNTIENFLLQIYATESGQIKEAFEILNKTLDDLYELRMKEIAGCKDPGWTLCLDGWCYPGKCPPHSGGPGSSGGESSD